MSKLKVAVGFSLASAALLAGQEGGTAMFESAKDEPGKKPETPKKPEHPETGKKKRKKGKNAILEAVIANVDQSTRAMASSQVLGWAQTDDADADDFMALAIGLAGLDDMSDDSTLTDDQIGAYNDALNSLATAAIALGADQDDVTTMINDDDDDAAGNVADAINENIDPDDDDAADDAVAEYSVTGDSDDDAILESTIKVVRHGVVKLITKHLRPRRMTSLQKAALKKAQSKSHNAASNLVRRKSMITRAKRGL